MRYFPRGSDWPYPAPVAGMKVAIVAPSGMPFACVDSRAEKLCWGLPGGFRKYFGHGLKRWLA